MLRNAEKYGKLNLITYILYFMGYSFSSFILKRSDILSAIGIVAEFNPLHTGHEYLLKQAKKKGAVVCVISGNFVQRGDTAVLDKRIRAKAALENGADLVLELPVLWSMSTAQNFALGAVSILNSIGCEKIMFGSEAGEMEELNKAVEILNSEQFKKELLLELEKGVTFAVARQIAAEKLGVASHILESANNNLGIEYMLAAKQNGFNIGFEAVQRKGAAHDSLEESEFVSSSLLRRKLLSGDFRFCKKYMSPKTLSGICEDDISDISRIETAILAVLRTKKIEELQKLPDISEGLENKLWGAIRVATDLEELYNNIKVKRYTMARVRRLVLSAFLGIDNTFFMKTPPYVRVLGFSKKGEQLLKTVGKKSEIPVVTKVSEIERLTPNAKKVLEIESRATDLFSLSLKRVKKCGGEYTAKIIKTE